jgi:hypothetical protein
MICLERFSRKQLLSRVTWVEAKYEYFEGKFMVHLTGRMTHRQESGSPSKDMTT